MYNFYWMDSLQSTHCIAFAKAVDYLQHNGVERRKYVDFLDTTGKESETQLNTDFDNYLYNNTTLV